MRAFIAIDIPADIKLKIEEIQSRLKRCNLHGKWVEAKNLHLTMKFLGEVVEEKISAIREIMHTTGSAFKPLEVQIEGFGFFPSERRPRVFFLTTDAEKNLKCIADMLEEALEKIGFEKESRFKSHITLCRLKGSKNIDSLINEIRHIYFKESFLIKEITLFKSTLTKFGPIYEEVFKAPLLGGERKRGEATL